MLGSLWGHLERPRGVLCQFVKQFWAILAVLDAILDRLVAVLRPFFNASWAAMVSYFGFWGGRLRPSEARRGKFAKQKSTHEATLNVNEC